MPESRKNQLEEFMNVKTRVRSDTDFEICQTGNLEYP